MRPPISYARVGAGPPVLLLHGLGGDHRQALDLLPADLHRTRLAPDLPGHGDADLLPGEPVSFAAFAGHVAALLDAQGLTAVPVAGVSMGAGIATALAASRPDLISRLILIRPAWLDVAPPPNLAAFPEVAYLLATLGPDAGAEAFRATAVFRELSAAAPAMALSLLGQFSRPQAATRARVLAEMPADLPLSRSPDQPPPAQSPDPRPAVHSPDPAPAVHSPHSAPAVHSLHSGPAVHSPSQTPAVQDPDSWSAAQRQGMRPAAKWPDPQSAGRSPVSPSAAHEADRPPTGGRHGVDRRAVEAAYAALAVDTLVVAAPQDPVHPEGLARMLSAWIPGSRLVLVPRKVPDRDDHLTAVQAAVAREVAGDA